MKKIQEDNLNNKYKNLQNVRQYSFSRVRKDKE